MLQRCAAVVAAAGLIVTVACAQTDAGISTNVKMKFAADDAVKAYQIDVDTRNGVVTLSGNVETSTAKDQALRIARATEGVRDVIDQLRVGEAAATSGSGRDVDLDDDLERRAERGTAELKQASREVVGTLREAGRDAADKVEDVADRTGAVVADAAITSAVKARFLADTTVEGLKIDVDTDAGAVTLNGTVASRAEADRAVMVARNTTGVKRVIDKLTVR